MAKPPKGKTDKNKFNHFHEMFHEKLKQLKRDYGVGMYSWGSEMTRKAARKIARKLARKQLKEER